MIGKPVKTLEQVFICKGVKSVSIQEYTGQNDSKREFHGGKDFS